MSASRPQTRGDLDGGATDQDLQLLQRLLRVARLMRGQDLRGLDDFAELAGVAAHPDRPTQITGRSEAGPSGRQGKSNDDIKDLEFDGRDEDEQQDDKDEDENDEDYDDDDDDESDEYSAEDEECVTVAVPDTNTSTYHGTQPRRQTRSSTKIRPHATVEQRYRSVVNSKIQQLNDLVPTSGSEADEERDKTKSAVLDRAAQHIDKLIGQYEQSEGEGDELRGSLQRWLEPV